MNKAYISVGTNLGDRISNIQKSYEQIRIKCGEVISKSGYYKSPPWGFTSDEEFVNTVIEIRTELSAFELLEAIQKIEQDLGRIRIKADPNYQDRIIDLDIIDYNGKVLSTENLVLPHPGICLRDFVLIPLAEISPKWVHPTLKKSIKDLINNLPNVHFIEKMI